MTSSSVRAAPRSTSRGHDVPSRGGAPAKRDAVAMRRSEQATIDFITRGKHPKVAERRPVSRALHVVSATHDKLVPAAAVVDKLTDLENVALLLKTPTKVIPGRDPMSDCRSAAFALEGYMRACCRQFGDEFHKHLGRVKGLEDAFGKLGYCVDMLTKPAAKTGADDVIRYWSFEVTEAAKETKALLGAQWLAPSDDVHTEAQKLAKVILHAHWPAGKRHRAFNAAALKGEAERVLEKDLDMNDLDQMHELRRTIRWFSILAGAMNGAVVLTDEHTPKKYRHMHRTAAAKSRFASLPVSADEKHPVKLSRGMWIAMSKMIEDLGLLKDNREQLHAVEKAIQATRGLDEEAAHVEALQELGLHQDDVDEWIAEAKRIQADARELFTHIVEQLEAQV